MDIIISDIFCYAETAEDSTYWEFQQERFMAGMFGFPYFKESNQISLPGRKGGYWYRSVDSPNFH